MDQATFAKVVKKQQETCRELLVEKGAEYGPVDRLHNFKISAAMQGCQEHQALAGMMSKHTTSIYDMIRSGEYYPMEKWDEKITDHLNYLLLLKAILVEYETDKQKS